METGKRIYRRKPESEWRRKDCQGSGSSPTSCGKRCKTEMRLVHDLYGQGAKNGIRAGRAAGSPYLFTGLLKCSVMRRIGDNRVRSNTEP